MIKILSITYLEGTALIGKGHQVHLSALHTEGPPSRRLGLAPGGPLVHGWVREESCRVLLLLRLFLPLRLRLELVHELKENFFSHLCRRMGHSGIFRF